MALFSSNIFRTGGLKRGSAWTLDSGPQTDVESHASSLPHSHAIRIFHHHLAFIDHNILLQVTKHLANSTLNCSDRLYTSRDMYLMVHISSATWQLKQNGRRECFKCHRPRHGYGNNDPNPSEYVSVRQRRRRSKTQKPDRAFLPFIFWTCFRSPNGAYGIYPIQSLFFSFLQSLSFIDLTHYLPSRFSYQLTGLKLIKKSGFLVLYTCRITHLFRRLIFILLCLRLSPFSHPRCFKFLNSSVYQFPRLGPWNHCVVAFGI
ncbi:hypothetical protein P152DRAFT_110132 [Eremomyces bilateralis CBS 781.70]|uniref:Uncharacterized protein n=1 Tax=Eremomyces bilateralis CBS 781.70 TaxID=1392243 RepID=A0A6G1GDW8_9PEZI|nr:uncharacterized protein P152DRAFT_110132 [Eremomyces bilateralis CBS 781.70]KAF1816081.1 hypothetical protein P152DRAFT_110132 [Eremomyces bilateralis CBS 781.70]